MLRLEISTLNSQWVWFSDDMSEKDNLTSFSKHFESLALLQYRFEKEMVNVEENRDKNEHKVFNRRKRFPFEISHSCQCLFILKLPTCTF